MRSEDEVRKLIDTLDRLNAGYDNSIRAGIALEDTEDNMAAFNSNAMMSCALRWVMGEDTIQVTS